MECSVLQVTELPNLSTRAGKSVWNFWAHCSDVIGFHGETSSLRTQVYFQADRSDNWKYICVRKLGNQWLRGKVLAVFSGYLLCWKLSLSLP